MLLCPRDSSSSCSKLACTHLFSAANKAWAHAFRALAYDSKTPNAVAEFFIHPQLRPLLLMAMRDKSKVEGRTSSRGKKMPPLENCSPGDFAALLTELHDHMFRFTKASPADATPKKQRPHHKAGSIEATAQRARLRYFFEVRFVLSHCLL